MPVDQYELLRVVQSIQELNNMQVTVTESLKGGMLAGATTIVGGLLMGSRGLALGGILGGLTAAYYGQGKFKSVISVIKDDLTLDQQADLYTRITNIAQNIDLSRSMGLIALLSTDNNAKMAVINEIISFIQNQVGLQITER